MRNPTANICANVPTFQHRHINNNQISINQLIIPVCFLLERWDCVGTRWNTLACEGKFCWNTFTAPRLVGTRNRNVKVLINNMLTSFFTALLERWSVGHEKHTQSNKKFYGSKNSK